MFQGILIFAIVAVVVVVAAIGVYGRRRAEQESLAPEDRLSDEQFRKIEFGDDD